jgi:cystathionine gamma-synthase
LRVERAQDSAMKIARWLTQQPEVASVRYIGLESHPQHAIARKQMSGFGAMISIRVRGGEEAAMRVAGRVRLFTRATSLGGVESLIEHRASVEGPDTPTPRDLLRLSIGIEDAGDLIDDLRQALA